MNQLNSIEFFRGGPYKGPAREEVAQQRRWGVGIIAAFILTVMWSCQASHTEVERIFRAQFHIPDGVSFAETRYPSRGTANQLEAIVRFSKSQFADYIARLDDPRVWLPVPLDYRGLGLNPPYSPSALKWTELPGAPSAGNRRVRWGHLSREEIYKARNGRAFCLALRQPPGKRRSDWWYEAPKGHEHRFPLETPSRLDRYNAVGCAELGRSERPATLIQGLIDVDTRSLHMIIR